MIILCTPCTVYTIQLAQYAVYSVYYVQCTVVSVVSTVTTGCTVQNVHYVQCAEYIVHCAWSVLYRGGGQVKKVKRSLKKVKLYGKMAFLTLTFFPSPILCSEAAKKLRMVRNGRGFLE